MVNIQTCAPFSGKRAIVLKKSYGDAFGKHQVFFDQKYHTLQNTVTKSNFVFLLRLKRAIGLKTSYGDGFGKLLVFFDQKYDTLKTFVTKTQKQD